jgi:hypothetical protein
LRWRPRPTIDDHSSAVPCAPAVESLFGDVTTLIEAARGRVALTVDAELTMLYWGIGRRIRADLLGLEKPELERAIFDEMRRRLVVAVGQLGAGRSEGCAGRCSRGAALRFWQEGGQT